MSNLVTLIAVDVELSSRWSVGGVVTDESKARLPIIRDPRTDRPWIPGASIAGSLRHHLADQAEAWLGALPGGREETTGNVDRKPSRLAVLGGLVAETEVDVVTSTAVDTARGAAAGRTLRSAEVAGPTAATLVFEHAGPHDEELLQSLSAWTPVFGRGRSTGLGRGVVQRVRVVTVDLATEEGLAWWLGGRHDWFASGSAPDELVSRDPISGVSPSTSELVQDFLVAEPVRVGTGSTTMAASRNHLDILMLGEAALIPGSSWKGVFRHRSLVILEALGASREQANGVCAWLFGSLEGGRGVLGFSDSLVEKPRIVDRAHIAIDRFTGGVKDGALFNTRALDRDQRIRLCIRWESGGFPGGVTTLLRHVMWDLHEGMISVGGMGSRGYGWLRFANKSPQRPGPVDLAGLLREASTTKLEAAS